MHMRTDPSRATQKTTTATCTEIPEPPTLTAVASAGRMNGFDHVPDALLSPQPLTRLGQIRPLGLSYRLRR
jgi:hypothetical protein